MAEGVHILGTGTGTDVWYGCWVKVPLLGTGVGEVLHGYGYEGW